MRENNLFTLNDSVQLLVQGLDAGADHRPAVRLFAPDANASWLISEQDPQDSDRLFGLCDVGHGFPELGYVSVAELLVFRGPKGLRIERDNSFVADRPLSEYVNQARAAGRITV